MPDAVHVPLAFMIERLKNTSILRGDDASGDAVDTMAFKKTPETRRMSKTVASAAAASAKRRSMSNKVNGVLVPKAPVYGYLLKRNRRGRYQKRFCLLESRALFYSRLPFSAVDVDSRNRIDLDSLLHVSMPSRVKHAGPCSFDIQTEGRRFTFRYTDEHGAFAAEVASRLREVSRRNMWQTLVRPHHAHETHAFFARLPIG